AGVQALLDPEHAHSGRFLPGALCALDGGGAPPGGQQRGVEAQPAVARDAERRRGERVRVGEHRRGVGRGVADVLLDGRVTARGGGQHRHPGLEGESLDGAGAQLPAAPGGGVGAGEHPHHLVVRVEQGAQGGQGGVGGAGEEQSHDVSESTVAARRPAGTRRPGRRQARPWCGTSHNGRPRRGSGQNTSGGSSRTRSEPFALRALRAATPARSAPASSREREGSRRTTARARPAASGPSRSTGPNTAVPSGSSTVSRKVRQASRSPTTSATREKGGRSSSRRSSSTRSRKKVERWATRSRIAGSVAVPTTSTSPPSSALRTSAMA